MAKKANPKKAKTAVKKAKKAVKKATAATKNTVKAAKKKAAGKTAKKTTAKKSGGLGKKHTCIKCAVKFYDLEKEEIICPKCGQDQSLKAGRSKAPKVDFDVDVEPEEEPEGRTDSNEDFAMEDEEEQY